MSEILDDLAPDEVDKSVKHGPKLVLLLFHLPDEVIERLLLNLVLLARHNASCPQRVELGTLLVDGLDFHEHPVEPCLLKLKKWRDHVFDFKFVPCELD